MKYLGIGIVLGLVTVFLAYAIFNFVTGLTSEPTNGTSLRYGAVLGVVVFYGIITWALGWLSEKIFKAKS